MFLLLLLLLLLLRVSIFTLLDSLHLRRERDLREERERRRSRKQRTTVREGVRVRMFFLSLSSLLSSHPHSACLPSWLLLIMMAHAKQYVCARYNCCNTKRNLLSCSSAHFPSSLLLLLLLSQ